MASTDWDLPINTTNYTEVLPNISDRLDEAASQFIGTGDNAATNVPTGAIKFNRTNKNWEEWSGTAWSVLVGSGEIYSINVNKLGGQLSGYYTNAGNLVSGEISNVLLPGTIGSVTTTFLGSKFEGPLHGNIKNSHASGVVVLSTGSAADGSDATFTGAAASATSALTAAVSNGVWKDNGESTDAVVLSTGVASNGSDATFTGTAAKLSISPLAANDDPDDFSLIFSATNSGSQVLKSVPQTKITKVLSDFDFDDGTLTDYNYGIKSYALVTGVIVGNLAPDGTVTGLMLRPNALGTDKAGIVYIYPDYGLVDGSDGNLMIKYGGRISLVGGLTEAGSGVRFGSSDIYTDSESLILQTGGDLLVNLNGSNNLQLVGSTGHLHVAAKVIAYSSTISDKRLKTSISNISGALDKVAKLNGVEFTRKDSGARSAGVIAQDVEKVLPQAVTEEQLPLHADNEVFKTVEYDALHSLYIEAIKELKAIVEKQAVQIKDLQGA
jgi:hypothetical protein